MLKQLKTYSTEIDSLITLKPKANFKKIIEIHLTKISFFQHERLIHLLVTLSFALLEMLSLIFLFLTPSYFSGILSSLLFILLVPYIFHYYKLENAVQKLYKQYDQLIKL